MKPFKEQRQDPHRPSVMDPADYVFVGAVDDHPREGYMEIDHQLLANHGVETGSSDRHSVTNVPFYDAEADGRPNFRCHHCGKHGSNIRYFCLFLHKPSKQVIVVGRVCAENRLSLSSRDEFESFLNRRDRTNAHDQWRKDHAEEVNYLHEYRNQRIVGGMFQEFLDSLAEKLEEYGSLTEGQINGLRKWMAKGKPWERSCPECGRTSDHKMDCSRREGKGLTVPATVSADDADRKQGYVTHTEDEPTDAQVNFINALSDDLGLEEAMRIEPWTRSRASDIINELKALLLEQRQGRPNGSEEPATGPQISFINTLMDERKIPLEKRREARRRLDEGLTKAQASRWIEALQQLPRQEE